MTARRRIRSLLASILLAFVGAPAATLAQQPPPLDLPSRPPEELPVPDEAPPPVLEDPVAPSPTEPPVRELRVRIDRIRVEGNTVLTEAELAALVEPYLGRTLATGDIEALRRAITRALIDRGYVTSGVLLPDQDPSAGVLVLRVYEGRIARVVVEGTRHLRDSYVRARALPDPSEPVRIERLERRLQVLQQDPSIQRLHARLEPGDRLGESVLVLEIEERPRLRGRFDLSNDRSPSIGAVNGHLRGDLRDATGFGDAFGLGYRASEGLQDVRALWGVPVTRHDTRVGARFYWAESHIVEAPFSALDISSDFVSGGLAIEQPIFRSARDDVRVGVMFEWRRGRNFVDGVGFSFAEGSDRGVSITVPIRLLQEWTHRSLGQVIAVRSTLSIGLPILDATVLPGAEADARFVSWIFQAQWARRFERARGLELLARTNLQLADSPLLPIEQFSLGGHASVRGYRENQIVTDDGFDASLEVRLPIWRRPDGRSVVQLATFADVGRGWSASGRTDGPAQTLASVGLGLRATPWDWLSGEIYWGHRLVSVPDPDDDLQDDGITFRLTAVCCDP